MSQVTQPTDSSSPQLVQRQQLLRTITVDTLPARVAKQLRHIALRRSDPELMPLAWFVEQGTTFVLWRTQTDPQRLAITSLSAAMTETLHHLGADLGEHHSWSQAAEYVMANLPQVFLR